MELYWFCSCYVKVKVKVLIYSPFLRLPKGHHITCPCIETHFDTMSYTQLLLQLLMLPVIDFRYYDFCPSHSTRYQLMIDGLRHSGIQRLLKAFTDDCVKSGIPPGTARSHAHFAISPHSVMTDYVYVICIMHDCSV